MNKKVESYGTELDVKPNTLKAFFLNVITSGKPIDVQDGHKMIIMGRYTLFNFLAMMAGVLLAVFYILDISSASPLVVPIIIVLGLVVCVSFVLARTNAPFWLPAGSIVLVYWLFCVIMMYAGIAGDSSAIWSVVLPSMAVFLLGSRPGLIVSLLLCAVLTTLTLIPGFGAYTYPNGFLIRISCAFFFILCMSLVVNSASEVRNALVYRLTRNIKSERDEMAVMKDNLKTGVFMLDNQHLIQPHYSRIFPSIMEKEELIYVNFLSLLGSSLQKKELELLADYFNMVRTSAYDTNMLENINPLYQFKYKTEAGAEKTLATTFAPITRENGEVFLLGSINDITHQAKLEQQLSDEEKKKHEEMQALFEVVHISPQVLNDFIEETEYEFEHINTVLKDKTLDVASVIREMYQGVHAIKSNAVILGLNGFALKLHALEDTLRTEMGRTGLSYQDVLRIMIELDSLMQVNDGLRAVIRKIEQFSNSGTRLEGGEVLTNTLERTVARVAQNTKKKAVLKIKKLDWISLPSTYRRTLKEVLVQLTRNSLYHGIELPADRVALGKNESGVILVSVAQAVSSDKTGRIVRVDFSDDGAGIDFERIARKAKMQNLVPDSVTSNDRSVLLKVLFTQGFSTAGVADLHAGRGVGLSLVYDRVKELNGTIQLQSEQNKGTRFTLQLPIQAARG